VRHLYLTLTFIALIGLANKGLSQSITNLKYVMQVDGGEIKYLISYDIQSAFDNIPSKVKVKLTAEINGLSTSFYLKEVSGDVGDLIYPGTNKKITWDYHKELIHFSGNINLAVESTPVVMVSNKLKRGNEVIINLSGFKENEKYPVKLFQRGNEVVQLAEGTLKDGVLTVLIPRKSKIKRKYQLAIQDTDISYFSNSFKIRRKFSLGWIIVPAVGVSAYLVIKQSLEVNEPLPGPPGSGIPNN
jgi:hypothetical protein